MLEVGEKINEHKRVKGGLKATEMEGGFHFLYVYILLLVLEWSIEGVEKSGISIGVKIDKFTILALNLWRYMGIM